jgi:hypothetical protein
MKITSDVVGNYSPTYLKTASVGRSESVQMKNVPKISEDEKNFFAKLYPEQKSEVLGYQFYNSKGKMSGASVGSLFDKRG